MGKIEITDDCLVPERFIYLNYSGHDPWGVAKKITGTIEHFFHVSAAGRNNDRINWDVSGGDKIDFYSTWWVRIKYSRFSSIKIYIKIQGHKLKSTNTGEFTMQLNGELVTKLEGWGIFLRPFWYMYSYLFYDKLRRRFIENCRALIESFRNEIKEHYNLKSVEVPRAHAVFG